MEVQFPSRNICLTHEKLSNQSKYGHKEDDMRDHLSRQLMASQKGETSKTTPQVSTTSSGPHYNSRGKKSYQPEGANKSSTPAGSYGGSSTITTTITKKKDSGLQSSNARKVSSWDKDRKVSTVFYGEISKIKYFIGT